MRKILLLAFLSISVFAREYYDIFSTPRSIAMGRATTAITDNWEALYNNPAGLALIEEPELRLPEFVQGYTGTGVSALIKKIKDVKKQGRDIEPSDLTQFDGTEATFGLDIFPMGYYRRSFGIAVNPLNLNTALRIRTPSVLFLKAGARVTEDTAMSIGLAQSFYQNHLRFGVTARPFHFRGGTDHGISNTDSLENSSITDFDKPKTYFGFGWGYDFDLGMQANGGPWGRFGFVPSVGFVMQNILNNDFPQKILKNKYTGVIPAVERRYNVGAAIQLKTLGKLVPTLSVEMRDYMIAVEDPFIERLSVALELAMIVKKWLRGAVAASFYKGNVNGGIYGNMGPGQLALITEAVNLGRGAGVGVTRRYYMRAGLVW